MQWNDGSTGLFYMICIYAGEDIWMAKVQHKGAIALIQEIHWCCEAED